MRNEDHPPVRCTSMRGAWPGEFAPGDPSALRNVQCSYFATVFFVDKYGTLWPRCEAHCVGWVRGGEPNPSDGAREISRDEYEAWLIHES